ncbi:hypothetical protein C4544_03180 [candidate division WS5 bacterium]|uniref:Uncharacterized protein n=1 Tax=candidate division WS5 bacterium TaxID=2093353 RepID=A0A419DE40_9BACT|nr:MAG: hypothetical protein C4544_03180 [candidate division WS5 bacterium]
MKIKLKLVPLLIIYVFFVVLYSTPSLLDDEARYLMFATNLSHGDYSTENEINLWNGPGYPILLTPFIFLNLPLMIAKLLNAFLLFIAINYIYKTLLFYMQEKRALLYSYILGGYPPFFRYIHQLMAESFSVFLVCGFLFHLCAYYQNNSNSWRHLIISSIYLGYLALTKIFFGYLILAGILLYLCLYLWKKRQSIKKILIIYMLSMIFCVPYLIYTYHLTGQIFYWGNSGGMSLYWMSSPLKEELGDWFWEKEVLENPLRFEKHIDVFKSIEKVAPVQKDKVLKKKAIRNIVNDPLKYFKNWLANLGRLLFNYPFSYSDQKLSSYFYLLPNMFLIVFFTLCIYPAYIYRNLIPAELWHLILFAVIFIAGSSMLSAYNRMMWPVVPIFSFWIFYILNRFIRIDIN